PRGVPLPAHPGAQRHRGACGHRPRVGRLPAHLPGEPRRAAHPLPRHGADVAGHVHRAGRAAPGGARRGGGRAGGRVTVAVVTGAGAADGIGFACARLLGVSGCQVVVTSTTARIDERVAELVDAGVEAFGVAADLTDPAAADRLVAAAVE